MSACKRRWARTTLHVAVRYRTQSAWSDAKVLNVSARGLMASCASPPLRGTYVEIRRGTYVVIGRVAWSSSDRFGLLSQDVLQARAFTAAKAQPNGLERRRKSRSADGNRLWQSPATQIAARSAYLGRVLDYAIMTAAVIAAACLMAQTISEALAAPFDAVKQALDSK